MQKWLATGLVLWSFFTEKVMFNADIESRSQSRNEKWQGAVLVNQRLSFTENYVYVVAKVLGKAVGARVYCAEAPGLNTLTAPLSVPPVCPPRLPLPAVNGIQWRNILNPKQAHRIFQLTVISNLDFI